MNGFGPLIMFIEVSADSISSSMSPKTPRRMRLTVRSGLPGIAVANTPSGNGISVVSLFPNDATAPVPVSAPSIQTSVRPTAASIRWTGTADDSNGSGLMGYYIFRDNTYLLDTSAPEMEDTTLSPGTTYTYTIYPYDFFNNWTTPTSFTVTTPPAGSIDPRQVGVRSDGAYWGASGEQMDMRSGNLNYSVPLLKALGRGNWGISFALSYNSQNWRQDPGGTWQLGDDVGYGYGWKLLAGSLTPVYSNYWTVHHYLFTDSTGAEYILDQAGNGVWWSKQSIYLWYDPAANRLYFPDGSFWVFGCTSAGTEQDAGIMYPTLMQDTNGNQVLIRYYPGANV